MVYIFSLPTTNRVFPVLVSSRWFSADIIASIVQALTSFYFPAHASREAALAVFYSVRPAPFDLTNRFPPTGAFITDYDNLLTAIITQLQNALSYSDRQLNINRNGSSTTLNDPTYLAAKSSYFYALQALTDYARDPDNYYDQLKFESTFTLTWV
jgi:hypothetical protein